MFSSTHQRRFVTQYHTHVLLQRGAAAESAVGKDQLSTAQQRQHPGARPKGYTGPCPGRDPVRPAVGWEPGPACVSRDRPASLLTVSVGGHRRASGGEMGNAGCMHGTLVAE